MSSFFFNDTATTEIYTLSLHDALPICQSVWRFIAAKYGREKIGEVFQAMKLRGTAEAGFKEALGMDFEELTEQWHSYIKKEYYPDVAGRDEVKDIAKRLTDHKKAKNFYNVSPTISPDGSKIAVLSDRSGYIDRKSTRLNSSHW